MKILLATILSLVSVTLFSQSNNQMVGQWEVCYQRDLSKPTTCSYPSRLTYNLNTDSTYTDNNKGVIMGKEYTSLSGIWSYGDNTLITDQNDTKTWKSSPMTYKPIWINKDTFYSIGNEGENKILVIFKRK
jgi:hypothetical protein